jgi:hypothetical protein
MAISLKFSSPAMLLLLLVALMLVLVPQPTRYILRTQSGDVLENVDVYWLENLETYPTGDCGHNLQYHLVRLLNFDQMWREKIDPCTMINVPIKEVMRRALEKLKDEGLEIMRYLNGRFTPVSAEEFGYKLWDELLDNPIFYNAVLRVLQDILRENGIPADVLPKFIR